MEPRSPTTEGRTLGYQAVDFATDTLGIVLHAWQVWLLVHMLELLPSGDLRFRTVVVLVARQNGKTTLSTVVALFFMYVLGRKLVLGTAQDLDVAQEVWQAAVDLITEMDEHEKPVRPDLFELYERHFTANGRTSLVLSTGERYKVKAANRRAGRSLSGDLILLDELREHQTWAAWAAITKTTMARLFALILCLSNAGDETSVVLARLRTMAHLALGNPDGLPALLEGDEAGLDLDDYDDDLGLFEWSASPGCELTDRAEWAQANPSLGHPNGISDRAVASAVRTDPEREVRIEVLCQWPSVSAKPTIFGAGKWPLCFTEDAPPKVTAIGLAVSVDQLWASIGSCGVRRDGTFHVGSTDRRRGVGWAVAEAVRIQAERKCLIVIDEKGPAGHLIDAIENPPPLEDGSKAPAGKVTRAKPGDYLDACDGMFNRVQDRTVTQSETTDLEDAVAAAVWQAVGDRRKFARKSGDISMLEACAWALWAAVAAPPTKPAWGSTPAAEQAQSGNPFRARDRLKI